MACHVKHTVSAIVVLRIGISEKVKRADPAVQTRTAQSHCMRAAGSNDNMRGCNGNIGTGCPYLRTFLTIPAEAKDVFAWGQMRWNEHLVDNHTSCPIS